MVPAGPTGVEVWSWDIFGRLWAHDILEQLKLPQTRHAEAPFGALPDLQQANGDWDQVFTWCGTTAGVGFQRTWIGLIQNVRG